MNVISAFASMVLVAAMIYWLIRFYKQALAADKTIKELHNQQLDKKKGQLYPLSPSHLLLMESIKIQDMELSGELTPMQLNFKKEQWYMKVEKYSQNYFMTLGKHQEQHNKPLNFADQTQRNQSNKPQ
jgi:hypothetical protein